MSAARLNNMEAGISPTYIAYTPTWTSNGSAPAIGNAVVTARYVKIGKQVHAYGEIIFGSSSTYGTGSYSFALPVTSAVAASIIPLGVVYALDSSTSKFIHATAISQSTTVMNIQYPLTYPFDTQAVFGQTTPWTWATSDAIAWDLLYEAA